MSNLSHLNLLPAALGWLFFSVALAFIAVMYIPSARAAEPASVSTPNANSLTWVHHKNFRALRDGRDCTSTGRTVLTIATPKGAPFKLWFGGPASDLAECKGSGTEVVQSAAFGVVAQPSDFDLAMKRHIRPPSTWAACRVAVKSRVAK
jgi:hypothetical protein